jgi:ribonuclease HI
MPMIATDGSSLGTPTPEGRKAEGPGAFGVVIRFEDEHERAPGFVQTLTGGKRSTTTGEIELLGFLCALEAVRAHKEAMDANPEAAMIAEGEVFTIVLDSEYVVKGYTEHLATWEANKWRSGGFRAIKHQVLWQDAWDLREEVGHMVRLVHTKGHTKRATDVDVDPIVEINDQADKAAGIASRAIRDTGIIPQPHPIVWLNNAQAQDQRPSDTRKLQALAELVLQRHGRGAAVEAFRLATAATGIKE